MKISVSEVFARGSIIVEINCLQTQLADIIPGLASLKYQLGENNKPSVKLKLLLDKHFRSGWDVLGDRELRQMAFGSDAYAQNFLRLLR